MERLFLWPPLLWSARILLLLYTAGLAYVSALFLARFLRPGNAWALMSGGLPRIGRLEGTAKVLGQEVTLNADVEVGEVQRLANLERTVAAVERSLEKLGRRPAPDGSEPEEDNGGESG